jgi:hypothetical protein
VKWYAYLGHFFAGAFLANSAPHFVMGITGQEFQTPFGDPSSATVNVLWGSINFTIGYSIATALGRLSFAFNRQGGMTALGVITMAIMLSYAFD